MSAEDHLRQWLGRGMTGCRFAAMIACEQGRLLSSLVSELADEADVSTIFEAGGATKLPAITLFSWIRSEEELVEQLVRLASGDRWRITEVHPEGIETRDVFVGIDWRVRDGLVSSVMGFGPFPSMPVTRRAPYACLAAWPGEHDNKFWTNFDKGIVHFLDTDLSQLGITKARYQNLTRSSVDATRALLREPPDDARFYRRAAFRLSPTTRALLEPIFARRVH